MTILITSNALAIGQSVSSKYNGLLFDYGAFTGRTASQDKNNHSLARLFNLLSTVKKYVCGGNHTGNLQTGNHKRQLVRTKVRTQVRTKNAIIKRLFIKVRGKVRTENSPLNCELDNLNCYRNSNTITETVTLQSNFRLSDSDFIEPIKKRENADYEDAIKRGKALANYLPDRLIFSRQAFFTQAEKLLFSFCVCSLICWIKSSSKRIWRIVLLERSKDFFSFLSCIGSYHYDKLNFTGSYHYTGDYLKKTIAQRVRTSMDYLTKPLKIEVMIMANRYHNAHPCAKQFKFINIVTSQAIQIIATTYNEAKKQVNNDYVLTVRKPLNQGGF